MRHVLLFPRGGEYPRTQSYPKIVQMGVLSEDLKPHKNFPSDSAYVFLQVQ